MNDQIMKIIIDMLPAIWQLIVGSILAPLLYKWISGKLDEQQRELVLQIARGVYSQVEGIARRSPNQIDDKAAIALKIFIDEMAKRGKSVGEGDQIAAKNIWAAMAAREHQYDATRIGTVVQDGSVNLSNRTVQMPAAKPLKDG